MAMSAGKKQLGLFAADLLESVLADRSRGFALRLDVSADSKSMFVRSWFFVCA